MEKCENCRFFHPEVSAAKMLEVAGGMCRRYAPSGPAIVPSGGSWQVFPPMSVNQWCGDYRPKSDAHENVMRAAA